MESVLRYQFMGFTMIDVEKMKIIKSSWACADDLQKPKVQSISKIRKKSIKLRHFSWLCKPAAM